MRGSSFGFDCLLPPKAICPKALFSILACQSFVAGLVYAARTNSFVVLR